VAGHVQWCDGGKQSLWTLSTLAEELDVTIHQLRYHAEACLKRRDSPEPGLRGVRQAMREWREGRGE